MLTRIGWLLFLLTVAFVLGETVVVVSSQTATLADALLNGFPVISFAAVAGALMGGLIISRHPTHPIGWLLSIGQLGSAIGLAADAYAADAVPAGEAVPPGTVGWALWLGGLLGAGYALSLVAALFLIAPDGRLPSPRWRPVLALCAVGLALHLGAYLDVLPTASDGAPEPGTRAEGLALASGLVLTGTLLAGAWSLRTRVRGAHGVRRAQLRWIAASAIALTGTVLLVLACGLLMSAVGTTQEDLGSGQLAYLLPFYLAYASLPVCTGIAVLRYRLYDIDVIINRAVVLTVVAVFVTVGYVAAVVVLGGTLSATSGGFSWSLAVTALVALAFQPVRRWVLRVADRVAYGSRAAPYEALAEFVDRLGGSASPERLLAAVAAAAGGAVSARRVTVQLYVPAGSDLTVAWPADGPAPTPDEPFDLEIRLTDDEVVGRVAVLLPPGRPLRAADQRLLVDLADQAAVAFGNARLEAQLAAHVAALDERTAELAKSRARIIEARDRERSRLEDVIAHDVLSHLAPLPELLAASETAARAGGTPDLDVLVARTTTALEALRELTRGIFPAQLSRAGLGPALRSRLGRADPTGTVSVDPAIERRRFAFRVEAAVFFCCTEALRDVAAPVSARLGLEGADLVLQVEPAPLADDLVQAMSDRVEALGGSVTRTGGLSGGVLRVRVPAEPHDEMRPVLAQA